MTENQVASSDQLRQNSTVACDWSNLLNARYLEARKIFCSPDGQIIVSQCSSSTLSCIETKTGQQIYDGYGPYFKDTCENMCLLAISPDSQFIIYNFGSYICFWNILDNTYHRSPILQGRFGNVFHQKIQILRFSPNGLEFATMPFGKNCISIWDYKSAKIINELFTRSLDGFVSAICYSPDGKFLVTGGHLEVLDFWIPQQKYRLVYKLRVQGYIIGILFSPNGKMIMIKSKLILLYDVSSKKLFRKFYQEKQHNLLGMAFHPNGNSILYGVNTCIRTYRMRHLRIDSAKYSDLKYPTNRTNHPIISPDGKYVIFTYQNHMLVRPIFN